MVVGKGPNRQNPNVWYFVRVIWSQDIFRHEDDDHDDDDDQDDQDDQNDHNDQDEQDEQDDHSDQYDQDLIMADLIFISRGASTAKEGERLTWINVMFSLLIILRFFATISN